MDGETPEETKVQQHEEDEITPDSAEDKGGDDDINAKSGSKKKRTWQKVNAADFYAPQSYADQKGGKSKGKGKGDRDGEKGKGKGDRGFAREKGDRYGGNRGERGDRNVVESGEATAQDDGTKAQSFGSDNVPDADGALMGGAIGAKGGKKDGRKGFDKGGPKGFIDRGAPKGGSDRIGFGGKGAGYQSGGFQGSGFQGSGQQLGGQQAAGFQNSHVAGPPKGNSGGKGVDNFAPGGAVGTGGPSFRSPQTAANGSPGGAQHHAIGSGSSEPLEAPTNEHQRPILPAGKGASPGLLQGMPMALPFGAYGLPYQQYGLQYPYGTMSAMYAMPYYVMPSAANPVAAGGAQFLQGALPAAQAQALTPTTPAERETLKNQVRAQIEYYFSQENLIKDIHLRTKVMNSEGWVPIHVLATFRRIENMTRDLSIIMDAISSSSLLELDATSNSLRLKDNWEQWVYPPGAA